MTASILPAREYQNAIAEVVCRAADMGAINRFAVDPGRGRRRADLSDFREARLAVHAMVVSPDRYIRGLRASVASLQPELGACIGWARQMAAAEQPAGNGMIILRELADWAAADARSPQHA